MKSLTFKIFQHYFPRSFFGLAVAEIAVLITAFYFGAHLYIVSILHESPSTYLLFKGLVFAFIIFFALMAIGLYWHNEEGIFDQLFRITIGYLVGIVISIFFFELFPYISFEQGELLLVAVIGFTGILILRWLYYLLSGHEILKKRFIVLGAGVKASRLDELNLQESKIVGYIPESDQNHYCLANKKLLQYNKSLVEIAKEHQVSNIIIALDERRKRFPVEDLIECKMSGIRIMDFTEFYESHKEQININELTPSNIIFSHGFGTAVLSKHSKRLLDLSASSILLILTTPLILLTILAILIDSHARGPVIYRQTRVGKDEVPFDVLKFRTMSIDAEKDGKAVWAKNNDPRVTRVGRFLRKFRIDELPQLINVIRGEMSFVGPRPERPEFVERLSAQIPYYRLRHKIKPGITGWAQISYPYGSTDRDAIEKLQYDLYYIKNYSTLLDLNILFQTVHTVLWGRGAR